jgi:PAS domain-containing protein
MLANQATWKLASGDMTESTDVPQLDADGNVVRWFGSNSDIEDRKRAETKLLEVERELRRIADAIPQTIVVLDPSGNALYANHAMLAHSTAHARRGRFALRHVPELIGSRPRIRLRWKPDGLPGWRTQGDLSAGLTWIGSRIMEPLGRARIVQPVV